MKYLMYSLRYKLKIHNRYKRNKKHIIMIICKTVMITGGKTSKRSKNAIGRQASYKPSQQKQGLPRRDRKTVKSID